MSTASQDFLTLFLQTKGASPGASINPSEAPEVLYKQYLDAGDFEKACQAAMSIPDRSKANTAKTEIWSQALKRARFSALKKVEEMLNVRLWDHEIDDLLIRYKSSSLLDAVEVVKRFGVLHWGPVIDKFLEELNASGTVCMNAIQMAASNGQADQEEIEKKRLEKIQQATEALYNLKVYGLTSPNQQQNTGGGGERYDGHGGRNDRNRRPQQRR